MSPLWITMLIPNMGAAMVSMEYGFRGPSSTVTTACAASSMAIGDAVGTIRDGRADVMVAGGSEAPITPIGVGGFYAMRAISQRNDDPETASRPFDAGRDGFVIGEGATIVVLEELEHARARGARIYGEIMGYGCTADAHHFTEPDPTGVNPARAMRLALEEAGHGAERDRLHQRARHLDARRRRRRDARHQDGARRGARLRGADLVDEVDDRATCSAPRARRSSRSRRSRSAATSCRRRSTSSSPIPRATSTTCRTPRGTGVDVRVGLSNGFGFGGHNASLIIERWDESDGRRVT